jgi:hypothetical protein
MKVILLNAIKSVAKEKLLHLAQFRLCLIPEGGRLGVV